MKWFWTLHEARYDFHNLTTASWMYVSVRPPTTNHASRGDTSSLRHHPLGDTSTLRHIPADSSLWIL